MSSVTDQTETAEVVVNAPNEAVEEDSLCIVYAQGPYGGSPLGLGAWLDSLEEEIPVMNLNE